MFKNIKLLKKLKEDSYEIEYENDYLNENNESIIYVKAGDKTDIINKYSDGENLTITSELSNYLQKDNPYLDISKPVTVKINTEKEFNREDKLIIKQAYRNHFTKKVSDVNEQLHDNKVSCVFMLLVAIVFLVLFVVAKYFEQTGILAEIFSLLTWVFAWDLTENLAFKQPTLRKEAIILYKLLNARIEFYN